MLITSKRRSRSTTRAFCLVLGLGLGVLMGGAAYAAGSALWPLWGVSAAFGVAVIGWWNRGAAELLLESWNAIARSVARLSRLALTGAAFLVIVMAGAAGSKLPWRARQPGASGWLARTGEGGQAFESQSGLTGPGEGKWERMVGSWAARSGNLWVWALLPPLLLLSRIQLANQRSLGGATYTLY